MKMMNLFVLGLVLDLAQTGSSSSCTATCTSTCPSTSSSIQYCNDRKAIVELDEKLSEKIDNITSILDNRMNEKQLNTKMNQIEAKLDRLMARANITDLYPPSSLLYSCEEINTNWPDSPSDYYVIADNNGHPRHVYCHMKSLCNSEEGWMRVAYFNMSDPTEECPPGFRLYNQSGIRACGRPVSAPANSCQSIKFPSYSISYSQVCGQVIGYQYAAPDAIEPHSGRSKSIDGAYVDGVSLTRGSPRKHIWTFMAAIQENTFHVNGQHECPCAPNNTVTVPSFIGSDYFCESGCPGNWQHNVFYTDSLWDGKQCGLIEKACCLAPGIPWFNKTLSYPTTDFIEMRMCGDQPATDEDSPVGYYEIYVK